MSILTAKPSYVFSRDGAWDEPEYRGTGETIIHGLIGSGETLLINGFVMLANKINGSPWAFPTAESVRESFCLAWQWEDTDGFLVNHFGHPYQGSFYLSAGRVNGFGFYESLFFSALGSFTWEVFGESNRSSINDAITTIAGSLSLGEISYRLFMEAFATGVPLPLAFLINPIAGFHYLVTGWKPPNTGKNLYEFQVYLGTGYAQTNYSVSSEQQEIFSFKGPFADIGFKAVYGNPFDQDTWIPFRHFELSFAFGLNPGNYQDFRISSDGYLFSFSPIYTNKTSMSTGLSLHLDFVFLGKAEIYDSTINNYSNALNWTIKYEYLYSQYTALQIKSHSGLTFWGSSKYYSLDTYEKEFNNYGFGFNTKNFISLEKNKKDRLELGILFYALWTYPETVVFSRGTVFWVFTELTYIHFITDHISLGITGSYAGEWGAFNGFPDTRKQNKAVKLLVAWNL